MKDVLVIGRNFHPDGKETAALINDALQPYLKERGLNSQLALFKDLLFDISNDDIAIIHVPTGRRLESFGAVLMTNWFSHASVRKDMALTIALYLEHKHVPLINSEALHSRSTSKLSQMMIAALNQVPIARTVFCLSLEHLQAYLEQQAFAMPCILKDAQASRGKSNYLINDLGEIAEHASEHSERSPFIAQSLITSDGSDYRFFVTGGQTKLVIQRRGQDGSHLNNTSAGATTKLLQPNDFDDTTRGYVATMSRLLGRELTGIDIMIDTTNQQPVFLEANPIPQIATGSNVEAKLSALADTLHELTQEEA
jgi:glutathione synthase/RimK-type ligase-like ATP-grasp enzyme